MASYAAAARKGTQLDSSYENISADLIIDAPNSQTSTNQSSGGSRVEDKTAENYAATLKSRQLDSETLKTLREFEKSDRGEGEQTREQTREYKGQRPISKSFVTFGSIGLSALYGWQW
jgi:hypothetical protein